MFVYNVKFSSRKFFKAMIACMVVIALILTGIAIYKTFGNWNSFATPEDVYTIDSNNYTNILKAVHDKLDDYIGQKISFSGYIYRVYDLQEDQFVLARDMVIDSDFNTLIVGFLCHSENSKNIQDGTWVNIVGEITKGYYHGDIPIIDVSQIVEIPKPADVNVYPPDNYYIPTSSLVYDGK